MLTPLISTFDLLGIFVVQELVSLMITGTDGSSSGSGRHERFGWYCILCLYRNSNIPCIFNET